ncbi:hypothetical protein LINGRAHAP2_LOCUS35168 [Linum grandiflorum]
MVCVMCLLPLFLVPIINLLPLIFDLIMGKIYAMFGWEYRKPERAPPACPYKPAAKNDDGSKVATDGELPKEHPPISKPVEADNRKED